MKQITADNFEEAIADYAMLATLDNSWRASNYTGQSPAVVERWLCKKWGYGESALLKEALYMALEEVA